MKKIIFFSVFVAVVGFACSPKTSSSTSNTASTAPTDEQMVAAAQTKYSNTTLDEFKKGHDLYFGTCTTCHRAQKMSRFELNEIPAIVDRMVAKGPEKNITFSATDKDAILKYMTGAKLTAPATK